MPACSVTHVFGRFIARTNALIQRFHSPLPRKQSEQVVCQPVHIESRLYLVIRLQMLWGEFCHQLVVRSALGGLRTLRGHVISPAPGVRRLADIQGTVKKPLSGPGANWHLPAFSVAQASALKVANYNEINTGLGAANVADLIRVRNYIVHPNESTRVEYFQATRNLASIGMGPDALIASRRTGGATLFETWVADCHTAAWNAIQ